MRLHQFSNLRAAQAFSDYLTFIKINNHIEHDNFSYQLILKDPLQAQQAQAELSHFLDNPNQDKYLSASWQSGQTDSAHSQHAYQDSHLVANFINHAGWLTHSIFSICLIIYLASVMGFFNPMQSALAYFTHTPFDLTESWRFVSPAFLHFSALHIVFNLLWWWQLGGIVEKQHGKQRLLILFLFTASAANIAQYFLVGPYFGGLSGVVYGLVGYCWLYGIMNKSSRVNLANSYFMFLLAWLVFGFMDLLPTHVANYAHLVGLLAGLLMAFITTKLSMTRN